MCILGLNSPGFKFHLTTKVVIAIIQSEATLPRKSLLCQVWPIFVNGFGLVVFSKNSECFSLFPERSLFCHLSFVICHLSFAKRPFKENFKNSYLELTIFL